MAWQYVGVAVLLLLVVPNSCSYYTSTPFTANGMYNKVPTIQCELADLTGNSLTDSLCSYRRDDGGNNHSIWMNNGEAWEHGAFADTPFTMFDMYAGVPMQQCVLADLNGDGLTDSLCSYSRPDQGVVNQVYVNDGRAWVSGAFEPPSFVMFQIEGKKTPDQQCDLADVNGDGLTDVVCAYWWSKNAHSSTTYINVPGENRFAVGKFADPPFFLYEKVCGNDLGAQVCNMIDLNGDGRADAVCAFSAKCDVEFQNRHQTYLNNGTAWNHIARTPFSAYGIYSKAPITYCDFQDVNQDGSPDGVCSYLLDDGEQLQEVYLYNATAHEWVENGFGTPPFHQFGMNAGNPTQQCDMVDVNGDDLPDAVCSWWKNDNDQQRQTFLNTGAGWTRTTHFAPPSIIYTIYDKRPAEMCQLSDVNGDSLTDVCCSFLWDNGDTDHTTYMNYGCGWTDEWDGSFSFCLT